ncbi:hypothetical protein ACSDBR_15505 [Acidithiobacillus ferriphilus]|uniref:hypothetical protein n=1 Tax=Acidithiobacillus ferriphilus TaxID=1689834 RepID=UPI003F516AF7
MVAKNDWMVLSTINAPRRVPITGDALEASLRAQSIDQVDSMALQTFFYECDLGAQLGFLRGRNLPVVVALSALDRFVRPGFAHGYHFPLDAWAA